MNRLIMTRPLTLILFLLLVACGARGAPPAAATPEPAPTEVSVAPTREPKPTKEPAPTEASGGTLQDVRSATIQIEAQGSFVDPQLGLQTNVAGRGSGFIIDPSGLAVTNNHVVTGAAILKVYIGGDDDESYNARVLGVSECSDLALIDIDGGDFPSLTWYEGEVDVGLDVYAAGFPLGDPEFTLTRGIVSKARTSGETEWASVDRVIEHDATINPGNSGGPLVDENGRVVGINYAGASATNQYFAIARDEALRIIDELMESDVNSIGVNGTAVTDGQSLSGIWVASVESGSPADTAGVLAGDIITHIEGLQLATDGTMADYCDVLRSHDAADTLSITVLRYATEEVLEGQLNGRELEPSFSFANALGDDVPSEDGSSGDVGDPIETYEEYTFISDDTEQILMEVPTEWSDVNGSTWVDGEQTLGVALSAAPDLAAFSDSWTTPGVFFGASRSLIERGTTEDSLLDEQDWSESCVYGGRESYDDSLYTGFYDLWSECGGEETLLLVLTAVPEDRAFMSLIMVQIASERDLEAVDHILNSFIVAEDLQVDDSASDPGAGTGNSNDPGREVSAFDLEFGQCFNDPTDTTSVNSVLVVDCATPHDNEIFHLVNFDAASGEPFPGEEAIDTFAEQECSAAFEPYVGSDYASSAYYVSYYQPSEGTWDDDDREIVCFLYEPDVALEGSARGSGR